MRLALDYRFRPGEEDDGITVQLPRELLPAARRGDMEWGVPGQRHEKVVALLRILPKAMRRRIGPAADAAEGFLAAASADCTSTGPTTTSVTGTASSPAGPRSGAAVDGSQDHRASARWIRVRIARFIDREGDPRDPFRPRPS